MRERFEAEVVRESAKAYLVNVSGGDRGTGLNGSGEVEAWLPKSQMRDVELAGGCVSFTIPAWLVREKGLRGRGTRVAAAGKVSEPSVASRVVEVAGRRFEGLTDEELATLKAAGFAVREVSGG